MRIVFTILAIPFAIAGGLIIGLLFMPPYLASKVIQDIWRNENEN